MDSNLFVWPVIAWFGARIIWTGVSIVGSSAYDFRQLKSQKRAVRRRGPAPLITVIVIAKNAEKSIGSTLGSITRSTYRKCEIIVVDQASTDNTSALVKQFGAAHPKKTIRLLKKRKPSSRIAAWRAGFRKWAKGELIVVLEAGQLLDRTALRRAAAYFNDPALMALHLNAKPLPYPSIMNVLYRLEGARQLLTNKTLTRSSLFSSDYSPLIARRETIAKTQKLESIVKYFAADVVVRSQPLSSFKRLLAYHYQNLNGSLVSFYRLQVIGLASASWTRKLVVGLGLPIRLANGLLIFIEPLLLTYFIYMAISFSSPTLLGVSWLLLSLLWLIAVFKDEHIKTAEGLRLAFLVPIMYLAFYVSIILRSLVAIPTLLRLPFLLKPKKAI